MLKRCGCSDSTGTHGISVLTTQPRAQVEGYSTNLFSARAEVVIGNHDPAAHGLFLYLAYQVRNETTHATLQLGCTLPL